MAQLSHYRENFKEPSDNITFVDTTLWRYKSELIEAVEETLKETSFEP